MAEVEPILSYDITISRDNIKEGCMEIAALVRPQWKKEDINFKTFSSGLMNEMVGLYTNGFKDAIVLRVFSTADADADRNLEINVTRTLGHIGLSSELICKFNNGICVAFLEGRPLTWNMDELREFRNNDKSCRAMLKALAIMHNKKTEDLLNRYGSIIPEESQMGEMFDDYMKTQFPDESNVKDEETKRRLREEFPNKEELKMEMEILKKMMKDLKPKTAFGNCDMNPTNLIYNEELDKMYMVDFEYCGRTYIGYDLAAMISGLWNGLSENPSIDVVLPPDDWLKKFIRAYLEISNEVAGKGDTKVEEKEVMELLKEYRYLTLMFLFGVFIFFFCNIKNEKQTIASADDLTVAKAWLEFYQKVKSDIFKGDDFLINIEKSVRNS